MNQQFAPSPLWAGAWTLFARNFPLIRGLALVGLLSEFAFGWTYSLWVLPFQIGVAFAVHVIMANAAHISQATGNAYIFADIVNDHNLPNRAFVNLSLMVASLFGVPLILVVITMTDDWTIRQDALFGILFIAVIYLALLSRLGTAFHHAAIFNEIALKEEFRLTKGRTLKLFIDLLRGAVLAAALHTLAFSALGENYVWNEQGEFSLLGTILAYFGHVTFSYVTLLGVVAICNAYYLSRLAE